jgi:hypothetical protein
MFRLVFTGIFLVCLAGSVQADSQVEVLPPPRVIVLEMPIAIGPMGPVKPGYFRPSKYDVWQNYGVGLGNRMLPRVILDSCQPYYRYNGLPYSLLSVRPLDIQR